MGTKLMESSLESTIAHWTPRRIILGTLVALSVVIGFLLVYCFRLVIVIILSGIEVSMAMGPGINWLRKHHLPRALSVILIYLALLVPPIIGQASTAISKIAADYQGLKSTLAASSLPVFNQIAALLPAEVNLSGSTGSGTSGSLGSVGQAFSTTGAILNGLLTLFSILLIGFYWTIEGETGLRILFRPFSFDRRDRAYEMLLQIELRVGGYLRGQLILAVTIGLADFTVYSIIGLPAALAVSLLAGLFEMIPMIGTTLGMIPALLVAFAYDPAKAVLVLVAGITVQAIENNLLSPRVMHKTVGINPIVTVLAIVAFGALFGFAGLLLAILMAAMIQIILERSLLDPQSNLPVAPPGRDWLSKLRFEAQEFVVDIRKTARHRLNGDPSLETDPIEDSLEEIALALDRTLAQGEYPEEEL